MSTTSSTLTSVLSALGGSTGIDVTSAVDAILYADRAPERAWAAQQTTLTSQTTALNQIETETTSLATTLTSLGSLTGPLNSVAATSSNTNVVTATATANTASSSHLLVVNNLASTGSWYSAAQTSSTSTLTSGGSFSLTVGGITTPISITAGSTDTLSTLAASINSKSLGVTANVITDSTGSRLTLVSTLSGSASDVSISSDSSGLGLTRGTTGKDASLTVDGVPITSATNTVSGAISGVTLNLQSASPGSEINLTVAPDTSAISTALSSFVTAFNTLISDVNSQFDYNSTTNTAGTLSGDSTVQSLQQALLNITNFASTSSGSSVFSSLTALGITTNSDGTLTLNSSTLTSALQSNSAAVANFFQGDAFDGFASTLTSTLDSYTDYTSGAFTVDLKSIKAEYADLTDQTNSLEVYLSSQQTILTAQYNAADIAIQQLPQKLKQINALLNPNSTSSS